MPPTRGWRVPLSSSRGDPERLGHLLEPPGPLLRRTPGGLDAAQEERAGRNALLWVGVELVVSVQDDADEEPLRMLAPDHAAFGPAQQQRCRPAAGLDGPRMLACRGVHQRAFGMCGQDRSEGGLWTSDRGSELEVVDAGPRRIGDAVPAGRIVPEAGVGTTTTHRPR